MVSLQQIVLKKFHKEIMEQGSPHITSDLKHLIIVANIDSEGNFSIDKTVITNTKGEKEEIKIKALSKSK